MRDLRCRTQISETRDVTPIPTRHQTIRVHPHPEALHHLRQRLQESLPILVVAEGYARIPESRLPPVPAALRSAPAPVVVLPSIWIFEPTVMIWSAMTGFLKVANGSSGIEPTSIRVMRAATAHFPDAKSVAYLRRHGFRSVVVLKNQVHTRLWADAGRAPAPALGLRRIDMGDSVLFVVEASGART